MLWSTELEIISHAQNMGTLTAIRFSSHGMIVSFRQAWVVENFGVWRPRRGAGSS